MRAWVPADNGLHTAEVGNGMGCITNFMTSLPPLPLVQYRDFCFPLAGVGHMDAITSQHEFRWWNSLGQINTISYKDKRSGVFRGEGLRGKLAIGNHVFGNSKILKRFWIILPHIVIHCCWKKYNIKFGFFLPIYKDVFLYFGEKYATGLTRCTYWLFLLFIFLWIWFI